jgi:single-strand DNA-binding protein
MDMNHWTGIGRLTRTPAPELKHLANGKCVVEFSIACNGMKRGDQEDVLFLNCEAWDKQAEAIAKYTAKGLRVCVEGRLKLDKWEARDGTNRSQIRLVARNVQFIDWADDNTVDHGEPVRSGGPTRPAPQEAAAVADDDEPPF